MADENVLPTSDAEHTKTHYVCKECWGNLGVFPVKGSYGMSKVICLEHSEHRGFIKNNTVKKLKNKSTSEYYEARANLRGIIPDDKPTIAADQAMKDLGF
jgi:hypothetical protein